MSDKLQFVGHFVSDTWVDFLRSKTIFGPAAQVSNGSSSNDPPGSTKDDR